MCFSDNKKGIKGQIFWKKTIMSSLNFISFHVLTSTNSPVTKVTFSLEGRFKCGLYVFDDNRISKRSIVGLFYWIYLRRSCKQVTNIIFLLPLFFSYSILVSPYISSYSIWHRLGHPFEKVVTSGLSKCNISTIKSLLLLYIFLLMFHHVLLRFTC